MTREGIVKHDTFTWFVILEDRPIKYIHSESIWLGLSMPIWTLSKLTRRPRGGGQQANLHSKRPQAE